MVKYGAILSDLHCGHRVGLTPPSWQYKVPSKSSTKRRKWHKIQEELWAAFDATLKKTPPLDFVVWNGDLIDGKGKRSGGTECISSSLDDQCDMAIEVVQHVKKYCKKDAKHIGTYGTPYHTDTDGDEWENRIAEECFDKIGAHEWIEVNGVVFDIKHHIGSSAVPDGRHTAVARDALWNVLWAEQDLQPRAHVIVRSHVHYYSFCGDSNKLAITTPALQAMGSKYGMKRCSGLVDWGLIFFKVDDDGNYEWYPHLKTITAQKARSMKV